MAIRALCQSEQGLTLWLLHQVGLPTRSKRLPATLTAYSPSQHNSLAFTLASVSCSWPFQWRQCPGTTPPLDRPPAPPAPLSPNRTRPAPTRLSGARRRTLRRPPAPLLPTGTRAALLTLLAPGAVGPPVADRHSTTSAGRHAVINLTVETLEIATPAAAPTRQVSTTTQ